MPWYAVYTKPRWEKKVLNGFLENAIDCYCPMQKVLKQWKDRKKNVEQPLMPSYVFVNINEKEKAKVRVVDGVVNFVYWLGKPAIIKEKEIEALKQFNTKHSNIFIEHIKPTIGTDIIISTGPFKNKKATIKAVYKKKIELVIESLGIRLIVENAIQ